MDTSSDSLPHGPNAGTYIDPDLDITHVRVWNSAADVGTRFLVVECPVTISGWAARPPIAPHGDVGLARGFTIARNGADGTWLFGDGVASTVDDGAGMTLTGV